MQRGKFVVISGPDGAGKTTLIQRIKELYGDSLVYVREPGGTLVSETIREDLFSEDGKRWSGATQFFHYFCARANLLARVIGPSVNKGRNVLADRFDESTFAYQVVGFGNRNLEAVFWEARRLLLVKTSLEPDLYILIDVPVEIGVSRRMRDRRVDPNHMDKKPTGFHKRVARGLKEFFSEVPHVTVDGTQSEMRVLSDVLEILKPIFGNPPEGPER